ncbi:tyrosine-type recombinase/integrase [Acetomicrobium sp. S15 = DSM 107314]|uniref:tyrosine-type recombinase/integrase n=1 Tax=Acetomicrobium sp. S15 = DSM 107314 TaxID=2529858 RepID=UPI003158F73A
MLTDIQVRRLAPKEKRYSVLDDRGLYLEIFPNGNKYWRLRKRIGKKDAKRSLGKYPDISLRDARRMRDRMIIELEAEADGVPLCETFDKVAEEWLEKRVVPIRTYGHIRTVRSRLDRLILPYIGDIPINDISAPDLLSIVRRIENRGQIETAHRVLQICGQIIRYAIATGRADHDPSGDLRGAVIPKKNVHYPTITDPQKIGALLRAMDAINGSPIIRAALRFQAYTFVRPGELRRAEWSEIDIKEALWKIPAEKMKMRRLHLVPLSRQVLEILDELRNLTGKSPFLFPSSRNLGRPMSDATVNAVIRRMGYSQQEFTGHGFRGMASTILHEHKWPSAVIERQLAHAEKNTVSAAYNHAEYIEERTKMMQWWADWLDEQK